MGRGLGFGLCEDREEFGTVGGGRHGSAASVRVSAVKQLGSDVGLQALESGHAGGRPVREADGASTLGADTTDSGAG
ncbi:hypothetical protein GCM10018790_82070 [Kitasatospora xanthocidica]|nr:hypothetical protein GCM10018790_82070 [Kitasatospora xanthocidica]